MGLVRQVKFEISGQVSDDLHDRDYEILKAKLQVLCAEYGVEFNESYE